MKKVNLLIIAIATLILFTSCSDELDRPYIESKYADDIAEITASGLSAKDMDMLKGYIIIAKLKSIPIEGLTYDNLLDSAYAVQEKFERKEKERKEQIEEMQEYIEIKITETKYFDNVSGESLYLVGTISNKSDKAIEAYKGQLIIYDKFDEKIFTINANNGDAIPVDTIIDYDAGFRYSSYNENHVKIKNTKLDKLKIIFEPTAILFKDGTKLMLDEEE